MLPNFIQYLSSFNYANIPIQGDTISSIKWNEMLTPQFKFFHLDFYYEHNKVYWFKFIWHKHYTLRYSCYAWKALLNRLKMRDLLFKRNIDIPLDCVLCNSALISFSSLFWLWFTFSIILLFTRNLNQILLRPNLFQVFEFISGVNVSANVKIFYYLASCCSLYYL